jgi:enterochelin esterase-like enzyme
MNRNTALLNGAILWATTLALSSWLLASGVSGAFGVAASNAGEVINQVQQQGGANLPNVPNNPPNVSADQARNIAGNTAKGLWGFIVGSLLSLAASLAGASAGARSPRAHRVS